MVGHPPDLDSGARSINLYGLKQSRFNYTIGMSGAQMTSDIVQNWSRGVSRYIMDGDANILIKGD